MRLRRRARALAVAQSLADHGLGWARLRVVACADNDRVQALAYDASDHSRNQRVEVLETDQAAPQYLDNAPASRPAS